MSLVVRTLRPLVLALFTSAVALAQAAPGVRLQDIDHAVNPGDDFYLFANGEWQKRTEIPADRTSVGAFTIVADKTDAQLKQIFADLVSCLESPLQNESVILSGVGRGSLRQTQSKDPEEANHYPRLRSFSAETLATNS